MLINRPLNASAGDRMVRLADFHIDEEGEAVAPCRRRALAPVAAMEAEFRAQIATHLQAPQGGTPPTNWFRWADQLRTLEGRLQGLDHWRQIEERMIAPMVAEIVQMLDQGLPDSLGQAWQSWRDRYLPELEALLQAFRVRAARESQAMSDAVAAAVNPHLPLARQGEGLSRKALWVLTSTPGVSCVLLGMRDPAYVEDGMGILEWPPLGDARKIYEAMAEVRAADSPAGRPREPLPRSIGAPGEFRRPQPDPAFSSRIMRRGKHMAKKALLVGINRYKIPGADLRGCVNDVKLWAVLTAYLWVRRQGHQDPHGLRRETAPRPCGTPSRRSVKGAKKGDVLLFATRATEPTSPTRTATRPIGATRSSGPRPRLEGPASRRLAAHDV